MVPLLNIPVILVYQSLANKFYLENVLLIISGNLTPIHKEILKHIFCIMRCIKERNFNKNNDFKQISPQFTITNFTSLGVV